MTSEPFTDSHAHVDYDLFDEDRELVLQRAREANVRNILNIALGPESAVFERAHRLVSGHDGMWLAVGVHPHQASQMTEDTVPVLREFAGRPKVVAIGEIGLDYHYNHSPQDVQQKRFTQLLDLALELQLPVSIHTRSAFDDTYRFVRERSIFERVGGVLHCYTGSSEDARRFLDLGAYISFSGIVTFKKSEALRDVVRSIPMDRLLVETDAPFLAPEPYRGKRNEPAYVVRVAETIASLKNISVDEVARATTENTKRLFRF
ncbi:MAG TPA: TatD family hydrolase [Bdellovibrionota bacterium]|nr:TatD family hydrolase [Bdellovibrionota bacterium]